MKVCPQCGENYQPFVDFCFADGEVLTIEAASLPNPVADAFDAPPPPKMLQGTQGGGGYTRSATPVPRARRPGRSLVRNDGGGVYSPPSATPVPAPTPDLVEDPSDVAIEAWDDGDLEAFGDTSEPEALPAPMPEPILPEAPAPVPVPTPADRTPPRTPYAEAAPSSHIEEDEEEDEDAVGVGMWMLVAGSVLAGLFVVSVGAAAIYTLMQQAPEDDPSRIRLPEPRVVEPVPLPSVQPTQPTQPLAVGVVPEPVEQPEPIEEPEPVEQPEPVEEPAPVAPDPVPQPDPNDGVVVVQPDPVTQPVPSTPNLLASVVFTASPSGSHIILDGEHVGNANLTLPDIAYGQHTLRLEKEGFETYSTSFKVETSRLQLAPVTLKPLNVPEPEGAPGVDPEPVVDPEPATVPEPAPAAAKTYEALLFWNAGTAPTSVTTSGGRSIAMMSRNTGLPEVVTFNAAFADGTTRRFRCKMPSGESIAVVINECTEL